MMVIVMVMVSVKTTIFGIRGLARSNWRIYEGMNEWMKQAQLDVDELFHVDYKEENWRDFLPLFVAFSLILLPPF